MTLAMSWDEWTAHDAVALAARVRQGDVTRTDLAAQVAAGIAMTNPALSAVVEVFRAIESAGQSLPMMEISSRLRLRERSPLTAVQVSPRSSLR